MRSRLLRFRSTFWRTGPGLFPHRLGLGQLFQIPRLLLLLIDSSLDQGVLDESALLVGRGLCADEIMAKAGEFPGLSDHGQDEGRHSDEDEERADPTTPPEPWHRSPPHPRISLVPTLRVG